MVGMSSALWKNGGSDPDAVWHHRSGRSRMRHVVGFRDRFTGRGTFGGEFGARHCNQWGLYGAVEDFRSDAALSQITLGRLVKRPITFFDSNWHSFVHSFILFNSL